MSEQDERNGFLSRWSQRKTAAKAEPEAPLDPAMPETERTQDAGGVTIPAHLDATVDPATVSTNEPPPLPDVETLKFDGDFLPFMAKDVDPALRNQAMKKLFTDPHYGFDNMDKLDIYLDDYSKPDPIPLEMLRGLNQAKRLFLFEDEEKEGTAGTEANAVAPIPPAACAACDPALPDSAVKARADEDAAPETVVANSAQPK